ncbi:DM13 domain-containing protein [Plasmodiophora brassicae]
MCGRFTSFIVVPVVLAVIGFSIYVAATYKPTAARPEDSPYAMDEENWSGTNLVSARFHPDRASPVQIQGVMIARDSPDHGQYLRFENVKVDGGDPPNMVLFLTGASFPVAPTGDVVSPVELDGTPDGLFFKTGSFNQPLNFEFSPARYHGAILWDMDQNVLVANASFE